MLFISKHLQAAKWSHPMVYLFYWTQAYIGLLQLAPKSEGQFLVLSFFVSPWLLVVGTPLIPANHWVIPIQIRGLANSVEGCFLRVDIRLPVASSSQNSFYFRWQGSHKVEEHFNEENIFWVSIKYKVLYCSIYQVLTMCKASSDMLHIYPHTLNNLILKRTLVREHYNYTPLTDEETEAHRC